MLYVESADSRWPGTSRWSRSFHPDLTERGMIYVPEVDLPSPFYIKYSSFIMSIFFCVKFKSSFFFGFSAKVSLVTVAVFRCQLFRLYIFLGRLWPDLSEVMEDDTFPDTLLSQLVQRCGTAEDRGRLDDTRGPETGVNLVYLYQFLSIFLCWSSCGLLSSPLSTGSHCHSINNWFSTRMRNHVTAAWPGSSSCHCFIGAKCSVSLTARLRCQKVTLES